MAGDSQLRYGQSGSPETQQLQQPQSSSYLQLPPNQQPPAVAERQSTGSLQHAAPVWSDSRQPSLLQPPPQPPPLSPSPLLTQLLQLQLQRPQSQPGQQHQAHPSPLPRHGSLAASPGYRHCGIGLHRADAVGLSVRQDDCVLDERSGVDRRFDEIRSAPWPAPEPWFEADLLLPAWQHCSAVANTASASAAVPAGGLTAAALPPGAVGGGGPWSSPAARAVSGMGPHACPVGPACRAGGGATGVEPSGVASAHSRPGIPGGCSSGIGPTWAGAEPPSRQRTPAKQAAASADTDVSGSPFVTLAGLWAQEVATRGAGPQHAATEHPRSPIDVPYLASIYDASCLRAAAGPASGRGAALGAETAAHDAGALSILSQRHTAPSVGVTSPAAFMQPASLSTLLLGGGGEPMCWQPAAPASAEPASMETVDVEQLFGGPGALAAASGGSGRRQAHGGSPSVAEAPAAGGRCGQPVPSGLQSVLSDFGDVSFSWEDDTDEAGDAFMDFSDADLGVAGIDTGVGGGGGICGGVDAGGGGVGAGCGDGGLGGSADAADGGVAGRSVTLEDLRPLFDRPVDDVVRLLRVGVNDFKRRCRALGIRRWPQRKLLSLRKLEEAVRGDRGLSDERRQALLASIARNREAIQAPLHKAQSCRRWRRRRRWRRWQGRRWQQR